MKLSTPTHTPPSLISPKGFFSRITQNNVTKQMLHVNIEMLNKEEIFLIVN
jgi:hypothetical protein